MIIIIYNKINPSLCNCCSHCCDDFLRLLTSKASHLYVTGYVSLWLFGFFHLFHKVRLETFWDISRSLRVLFVRNKCFNLLRNKRWIFLLSRGFNPRPLRSDAKLSNNSWMCYCDLVCFSLWKLAMIEWILGRLWKFFLVALCTAWSKFTIIQGQKWGRQSSKSVAKM